MRRFSKKRAKENRKYLQLRKKFLESNEECKAGLPGCQYVANQIHHKAGRIGNKLNDVSTWLPVCGNCHHEIEINPEMAKEMGLSKSRLSVIIAEGDKDLGIVVVN